MTHFRSRILIVEDEDLLAENLRDFLLRREAQVRIASSAEAALDDVYRFQPEYVVLDYGLPGITGIDAFVRFKTHSPALRGVLISGQPTDELLQRAAAAGIDKVLTKPFSFAQFEQTLAAWDVDFRADGTGADGGPRNRQGLPERRTSTATPRFPLGTSEGWVMRDRRRPIQNTAVPQWPT